LPDNSVRITSGLFDFFTGENLLGGIQQDVFACQLGSNEATAGARLFRWPWILIMNRVFANRGCCEDHLAPYAVNDTIKKDICEPNVNRLWQLLLYI
jgi:hypothetical protein